jgi:hypothetical protein
MHFLAHYYTELPANNPLFVAALAVPDLTPRFTKIYNSIIVKHVKPKDENLQQIHRGIVQHFEGDKRFHNSPLFKQQMTNAINHFLEAGLSRDKLRLSVIAHVAVEMMIDRQIILANETICTQYYELLESADETILTSYFNLFVLENEKKDFFRSFQFYKQKRFLFLFNELENIVFGLDKVYGSVTRTEFTATEKEKFLAALHNIDNDMRYSWQEILNQ